MTNIVTIQGHHVHEAAESVHTDHVHMEVKGHLIINFGTGANHTALYHYRLYNNDSLCATLSEN